MFPSLGIRSHGGVRLRDGVPIAVVAKSVRQQVVDEAILQRADDCPGAADERSILDFERKMAETTALTLSTGTTT